jgi:dihydroxyacetone kinase-like protein
LQALGRSVNGRTRSMGVALTSCTVPAAGKPNFELGDKEVEMGVGIHGEPGRRRIALGSARAMVEEIVKAILDYLAPKSGGEAILFVNGFGATPLIELYLLYHEAARMLEAAGLKPARSLVGSYVTSLDMAGASITVSMLDDNATMLWDAPVHTPALRWGV